MIRWQKKDLAALDERKAAATPAPHPHRGPACPLCGKKLPANPARPCGIAVCRACEHDAIRRIRLVPVHGLYVGQVQR